MDKKRPHIICHMMTTLDGKITFGTINGKDAQISLFGDYMDLYNLTHEKLNSTAWMCGRVTMSEFDQEDRSSLEEFKNENISLDEDFIFKNELNNYAIAVDTKGLLRWKDNFLYIGKEKIDSNKFNLVTIVTRETPKEYLSYLKNKNISYIIEGENINFKNVFTKLRSIFNIETILLEGGGNLNGSIINEDLIDEISLLLIPLVVNNTEAPALFYKQLSIPKIYDFELLSSEKLDKDVMWMRYKRKL